MAGFAAVPSGFMQRMVMRLRILFVRGVRAGGKNREVQIVVRGVVVNGVVGLRQEASLRALLF